MKRLLKLIILGALAGGAWVLLRELLDEGPQSELLDEGPQSPSAPVRSESSDSAPAGNGADLGGATRAELYERAKQLDVEGRSKMSKEELAEAIAAAQQRA